MQILTPNAKYKFEIREVMDSDPLVVKEMWSENVYQIEPSDFGANNIFIDIGANIGAVSIKVASFNDDREGKPKIQTYAYEPLSSNVEYLNKNIKLNGKAGEIKIIQKGVWKEAGSQIITDAGGSSSILPEKNLGGESEEIEVITLEQVFKENGINECDVMKIDVEGAEYQMVLNASPETLMKIRYLTLEFDGGHEEEFGRLVGYLSEYFNLHVLGRPSQGGYIYGRRY